MLKPPKPSDVTEATENVLASFLCKNLHANKPQSEVIPSKEVLETMNDLFAFIKKNKRLLHVDLTCCGLNA